jgi:hypothetical protein
MFLQTLLRILGVTLIALSSTLSALQAAETNAPQSASKTSQAPAIAPQAEQILRQMSDYLAKQNQFQFNLQKSVDVVLDSGQKLQFDNSVSVTVRRPNGIRTIRKGLAFDQELFYDGKQLTLYRTQQNYYASIDAPPTIDQMLDYAIDKLGVTAPAADLLYSNPYQVLMENVKTGNYVGETLLNGVKCHQLAFRGKDVDWQIWIEDGDRPVPRKFVLTSTKIKGAPQYIGVFSDWDFAPQLSEAEFTFVPPKEAVKISFLGVTGSAKQ